MSDGVNNNMSIGLPPVSIQDENVNLAVAPEQTDDLPDLICDECGHVVGWDNWCYCHDDEDNDNESSQ